MTELGVRLCLTSLGMTELGVRLRLTSLPETELGERHYFALRRQDARATAGRMATLRGFPKWDCTSKFTGDCDIGHSN